MQPCDFTQIEAGATPERWIPSTCGICSVGCGVEVAVQRERIVGIRGRADHPVNAGRLGPKGLNQWYANRHPSRALHPMIRHAGRLVRASWDDAMDLIVARLVETIATEGPEAVGFYNSGQLLLEEYYTLGKIARGGIATPYLDANTRLCTATTAASLMENFGADGPPAALADLDETECIVLFGHNVAEQSTVVWMRILAAKAGPHRPKVIVVDPRRTFTVATGADLHLPLRPGTNVALLNGICHLLIENGWIDRAFIDRHTVHFDDFREIVGRYPPAVVERICGVPEADLRLAAEWIGRSRSTVSTCLQGVYQSNQATAAASLVNSMHLLMGKIGRPGSGPFQFAGQPSSMNTRETGADGAYPAYRNWEDPDHMADLARRWNVPLVRLGKKPATTPEIFEAVDQGHIRVLWTIATNPAVSMTDRPAQLRALARVFLVVQDGFADTETAQLADVFLPAAIWGEKTGCMTNTERRCNLVQRVVPPPGEARSDLDIFLDLARRLGLTDADGAPLIQYATPEGAFDEWRMVSRGCIPDYSGMTYATLLERGGIQWPCNDAHPDGTTRLYADAEFPTDWRIAESYMKDLHTGHEHTQREYRAKEHAGKARLLAVDWEPPLDTTDDAFPMTATSGRQVYHWHTRTKTAKSPTLQDAAPAVFVALHEEDAGRLGIADGDVVRVTSRRGAVEARAKVGGVSRPGSLFIPFHYGTLGEPHSPNALMAKLWDPVSKQPVQKAAAVRVERVGPGDGPPWWTDAAPPTGGASLPGGVVSQAEAAP